MNSPHIYRLLLLLAMTFLSGGISVAQVTPDIPSSDTDLSRVPPFNALDSSRLEFFPLQIGNLWQGRDRMIPSKLSQWRIAHDTVLAAQKYFVKWGGGPRTVGLMRIDSLFRVQRYIGSLCINSPDESNYYRLGEQLNTVYEACEGITGRGLGKPELVKFTGMYQATVFGSRRNVMEFGVGGIGITDTIYDCRFYLVQGIGIYREEYELSDYQCTGAIINGKVYGTILNTEEGERQPVHPMIIEIYPNPANESVKISFLLRQASYTVMNIYRIDGTFVKNIITETMAPGQHTFLCATENLKNGMYFCTLSTRAETDQQYLVKKFIIIE